MAGEHTHPYDPDAVAHARREQLTTEQAERLAALMALVGDPVRARVIFALLAVEELCVGDVALAADVITEQDSRAVSGRVDERHAVRRVFGPDVCSTRAASVRPGVLRPLSEWRPEMAKDPVCGMMVEEDGAPATVDHDGTTYYFCSKDCAEEFEENPEDYT